MPSLRPAVVGAQLSHGNLRRRRRLLENQVTNAQTLQLRRGSTLFEALAQYFTEGRIGDVLCPDFTVLSAGISAVHILCVHQDAALRVDAMACASSGGALLVRGCGRADFRLAVAERPSNLAWDRPAIRGRSLPKSPSIFAWVGKQWRCLCLEPDFSVTADWDRCMAVRERGKTTQRN